MQYVDKHAGRTHKAEDAPCVRPPPCGCVLLSCVFCSPCVPCSYYASRVLVHPTRGFMPPACRTRLTVALPHVCMSTRPYSLHAFSQSRISASSARNAASAASRSLAGGMTVLRQTSTICTSSGFSSLRAM